MPELEPAPQNATAVGLRIIGFFLGVVGLFAFIAHLVPQASSYPPKALTPEEFAGMSPEQMVAKGREIFGSSGERCSQCHMIEGAPGRGPNLGGIGGRAAGRAQERAKATGRSYMPEEYLVESLVEPNAYVVQGFSKPSIMPEVYRPPLDLSEEDIKAAVAYLQSLGGSVSVTPKTRVREDWKKLIASAKEAPKEPIHGDLANGKDLFYNRMRCVACHATQVNGKPLGGILGPDLSRVGNIRGAGSLKDIVAAPPGDIMPKHYKENLTARELDDLVIFLMSLRGAGPQ